MDSHTLKVIDEWKQKMKTMQSEHEVELRQYEQNFIDQLAQIRSLQEDHDEE